MSAKQNTALVAASAVAGVALGSLLLRSALKPVLNYRAANFIKQMLADANIIVGRDMFVHDDEIFLDWVNRGMLAIGESYMAKKWEAIIPLDELLTRLLLLPVEKKRKLFKSWNSKLIGLGAHIFNYQSPSRAGIVGAHHYDIGNDFFKLWLDPYMQYSCAYWKGITDMSDLDKAQEQKLHMIAQKLKLEPGMRVLEIGCGWGGLACFLAKNYGVHVTGITISNEQLKGAREWAAREGVSHLTSFEYCDYREMKGQFDRVVSIAMLEAVGYKNMDHYYHVIERCLKDGGLALVHSIAANRSLKIPNQLWILKYIFPNGFLPSMAQMLLFTERKLVIEDVHNLGPDYDKTLMCWNERFQKYRADGTIKRPEVFNRMWEYYLMYCAAGFRARTIQLTQIVYSKKRFERYDTFR
jgi:cyclopropane-fatty-acyl-phospholipid synthase